MIKVNGKYTNAKIYTNTPQEAAIQQIDELVNQSFMVGTKVRIMPDYHAGKGCVIGTTIQLNDRVVPNLVGVDVGCGVLVSEIGKDAIDFNELDTVIRRFVPSGNEIHETALKIKDAERFENENFIARGLQNEYTGRSLGTLGGGNHFIELAKDVTGIHYLLIHTGSRYVGAKVANWHQKRAFESLQREDLTERIAALKEAGNSKDIQKMIKAYKNENPVVPKDLAYLEGDLFQDYIADMKLAQRFAYENRMHIAKTIAEHMKWESAEQFDSVHNYIDTDAMILRKGAVRAAKDEKLVIPMNMRDGSLICIGKGNAEWNESAPHGAGRIYSRTAAMKNLSMDDFKQTMQGIWTTSVSEETLDEAPMAYKPMQEIVEQIGETVTIDKHVTPVYNFKASDKWKR
ncbi:RNA-splicing ligase RtcB [Solibacillus isronensis B3W22]|uniref:3'-phosphate/5'-hydroxy nucleic acid ligase n=1 Tax=Solibacillus isronensis B3W22 TaxID=1224748 RepID=K1LHP0_9BACL|nr:RNA-splicing ligase RtcB [Solibacillus isronensis]AMO84011.1 RNA-splicing ligase RtcB [Solibacillus silvestris]EKB43999.1 RNA-splicing ligase RtcB [Solibacillus isronensis B3W22]